MKILLVAATRSEIEPFIARISEYKHADQLDRWDHTLEVLITGVGMVATAYALGKQLSLNTYDLAINAGIAGSFDFTIPIGEVVQVSEDTFAELGAEDGDDFLTLKQLGLGEITQSAFSQLHKAESNQTNCSNFNIPEHIRKVKAITVNKVHGHEFSIAKTLSRFNAQVESMEGAAFFYACNQSDTPCLQIRSISNYVEPRNKEKWNMTLAVGNLNDFLYRMLTT